jgi:hypothetical protein
LRAKNLRRKPSGLSWKYDNELLLTAKTQRSQRRWFFVLAVRARQSKSLRLFEARALPRPLPEAERLSFPRPPLTAGEKRTSTLCVLGASAMKYVTAFMKWHT